VMRSELKRKRDKIKEKNGRGKYFRYKPFLANDGSDEKDVKCYYCHKKRHY
jgi:hypothetical protein